MTILPKRNKRRLEQRDQEASQHSHHGGGGNSSVGPVVVGLANNHSHTHGTVNSASSHPVSHNALYQSLPLRLDTSRSTQCSEGRRNRKSPPVRLTVAEEASSSKKRRKHAMNAQPSGSLCGQAAAQSQSAASTSKNTSIPFIHSISAKNRDVHSTLIPPCTPSNAEHYHGTLTSHMLPGGSRDTADRPSANSSPCNMSNHSDDEFEQQRSPGGCNSEDEYTPLTLPDHTEELERSFEIAMKKELGLIIKQTETDGSCLFRAVADQVYGDQNMHDVVRSNCIDYMAKNSDHFSHYVTENYEAYLRRKRQLGCHGNHVELQALSEMYNRPIEVYQYSLKPMNTFNGPYSAEHTFPIRLSYHRCTHYNSLIDPNKASIGVGLGLPGFKPGHADQSLLSDAVRKSEDLQIEQTMLQDKIRETDWELTDEALQEQVARESYLQWLEDRQKRDRRRPACTVTGPSCSGSNDPENDMPQDLSTRSPSDRKERLSNSSRTPNGSPKNRSSPGGSSTADQASANCPVDLSVETKTFLDYQPLAVFGFNDKVDENEALARAIAESQQEYFSNLRKSNH